MAKYLEHFAETDRYFTKGQRYEVVREEIDREGDDCYILIDDEGDEHHMNKSPDDDGLYVGTWFREVKVVNRGLFKRIIGGILTGILGVGLGGAVGIGLYAFGYVIFSDANTPAVRTIFVGIVIGFIGYCVSQEVAEHRSKAEN